MSELVNFAKSISLESESSMEQRKERDLGLIMELLEVWDQKELAAALDAVRGGDWSREYLNRLVKGKAEMKPLTSLESEFLLSLKPSKPAHYDNPDFTFIDLFAGIGGIRSGFESIGGKCVFTSEWNKYSQKTYKANWYSDSSHIFNEDIREVTFSNLPDANEEKAYSNIDSKIPDHDVLLAGFPCQPFSLAGVSKKNALGRAHGFECEAQGTLFFDVARIIRAKQPACFLLENVKNLKSHDKGKTFRIILETLDELGYEVLDREVNGARDPKIVDAKQFVPQHRERIALVGYRKDLRNIPRFSLSEVTRLAPSKRPTFRDILDTEVDEKYTLTPKLWGYLYNYAKVHKAKGNGFGFGLVDPNQEDVVARTLSARYHKDGSEILVDHRGWDMDVAEADFWDIVNQANRPRRLTPRECARLMGFEEPHGQSFKIPVSDTQAYRQFGNSVVVPVFRAIAELMKPMILEAKSH